MTKKKIAPKRPPVDAAKKIEDMAGRAASDRMIARRFGKTLPEFREWLETYPELQEAMYAGRDAEHAFWYKNLCMHAQKTPVAAIFALKARHGYREGEGADRGGFPRSTSSCRPHSRSIAI